MLCCMQVICNNITTIYLLHVKNIYSQNNNIVISLIHKQRHIVVPGFTFQFIAAFISSEMQ